MVLPRVGTKTSAELDEAGESSLCISTASTAAGGEALLLPLGHFSY